MADVIKKAGLWQGGYKASAHGRCFAKGKG